MFYITTTQYSDSNIFSFLKCKILDSIVVTCVPPSLFLIFTYAFPEGNHCAEFAFIIPIMYYTTCVSLYSIRY